MIQIYIPPSRWWRREHRIALTVWPVWLAQRLCPHRTAKYVVVEWLMSEDSNVWRQCMDCYKWIK